MALYAQSSLLSSMFSIMGNIRGLGGGTAWAIQGWKDRARLLPTSEGSGKVFDRDLMRCF